MCGIFASFNSISLYDYERYFNKGIARGPDHSIIENINENVILGFHRLSINGIDKGSNQPINFNKITLICNGEIYNYKELFSLIDTSSVTNSDCEIIIHLYLKYGIESTLQMLDGVFSFVLLDNNKNKAFVARDPFGVRPLFYFKYNNNIIFSSEIKMIPTMMLDELNIYNNIKLVQFNPGNFMEIDNYKTSNAIVSYIKPYTLLPFSYSQTNCDLNSTGVLHDILENINYYFKNAVKKRCLNTDREFCCLLSGGLDSSLVCAIANKYAKHKLKTFSIGLKNSVDIINARKVATFLNTEHHEVIVSEDDFFNAIPEVIENIESYDTTTVRASVGNYLISKYISENTDCKVVLNGDGADELSGGYLYFSKCNDPLEFDKECKRLLHNIHYFDVLRSDKSISSNGLEARTPFLDREFVQYYLSISPIIRCHTFNESIEKYLIRHAFNSENLLPTDILWRRKEAFSDGVSGLNKSWSEIIQEKIEQLDFRITSDLVHNVPVTKEQQYYRSIFNNYYPNCGDIIPYFWMPKYVEAHDSSARTLSLYTHVKNNPISLPYTKEEEPWDELTI